MEVRTNIKYLLFLLVFLLAFSFGVNRSISGEASNFGGGDSVGPTDCEGNPTDVPTECGGGGDPGSGGGPACVPCPESCQSESNACGQFNVGTQDLCCNKTCNAQTPELPTFDFFGQNVQALDRCELLTSTTTVTEVEGGQLVCEITSGHAGVMDCSGRCDVAETKSCRFVPTNTPTSTPPESPIVSDPPIVTPTSTPCEPTLFTTASSSSSVTVSVETEYGTSTIVRRVYEPATGEVNWNARLRAITPIVRKNKNAYLLLSLHNVVSCDIESSDGKRWQNVGENSRPFNFTIIRTHKLKSETRFRISRCLVDQGGVRIYVVPETNSWRLESVITDTSTTSTTTVESVLCPDMVRVVVSTTTQSSGLGFDIPNANNGNTNTSTDTGDLGNLFGLGGGDVNTGTNVNTGVSGFGGFFGVDAQATNNEIQLNFPQSGLPNKPETIVNIAPDWTEQ